MTHSTLLGFPCLLFLYLLGNYVNYQGQVSAEVVGNRIMATTSQKDIPKYMLDIMRREGRTGTVVGRKVVYQGTTRGKSVPHGAIRGRKVFYHVVRHRSSGSNTGGTTRGKSVPHGAIRGRKVFYKVVRHRSSGGNTGGRGKVIRKVIRHGTHPKTGGTIIRKIIRQDTSGDKNVPHKSGGKVITEVKSRGKSSKTGRKVRVVSARKAVGKTGGKVVKKSTSESTEKVRAKKESPVSNSEMHKAMSIGGKGGTTHENIHHFLPEYEATIHVKNEAHGHIHHFLPEYEATSHAKDKREGRGHIHHFLPDQKALSTGKKRSKNKIPKAEPESIKDDDDDDDDDDDA